MSGQAKVAQTTGHLGRKQKETGEKIPKNVSLISWTLVLAFCQNCHIFVKMFGFQNIHFAKKRSFTIFFFKASSTPVCVPVILTLESIFLSAEFKKSLDLLLHYRKKPSSY